MVMLPPIDMNLLKTIVDYERRTNEEWKKRGTYLRKSGLIVAPEDFYDYYSKKRYFTWWEALKIDGGVSVIGDWRLPTMRDWKKIHRAFKPNNPEALQRMVDELHLDYTGYIYEDKMIEYGNSPDEFKDIARYGTEGYYWTRSMWGELTGFYAKDYQIIKDYYGNPFYNWRFEGRRIRCVMYI